MLSEFAYEIDVDVADIMSGVDKNEKAGKIFRACDIILYNLCDFFFTLEGLRDTNCR